MFDGDLRVIKQAALKLYFFYSIWRVEFRALQITDFFFLFGSATEWQNKK